jgi:hypothetical protein
MREGRIMPETRLMESLRKSRRRKEKRGGDRMEYRPGKVGEAIEARRNSRYLRGVMFKSRTRADSPSVAEPVE